MGYIIFEFNNTKYRKDGTDFEIKKIFEDIIGIKIERKTIHETEKQTIEINNKPILHENPKEKKHPSTEELIDLFSKQSNFEFGSELIKEKFYPNLNKMEWRKTFPIIYPKIKIAIKKIEEKERGHFIKRKEGRYTYYIFVKDKTLSLSEYGDQKSEKV